MKPGTRCVIRGLTLPDLWMQDGAIVVVDAFLGGALGDVFPGTKVLGENVYQIHREGSHPLEDWGMIAGEALVPIDERK